MEEKSTLYKISDFVVSKRKVIYVIFAVLAAVAVFLSGLVKVNNSLTSYLPKGTQTKLSTDIMDREFVTYATTKIMVSNITAARAEELKEVIEKADGVKEVTFEDDEDHFKNSSALFEVTLTEADDLDRQLEIVDGLKELLKDYDSYFYSDSIDDSSKMLDREVSIIMLLAIVVLFIVLTLTTESFTEVPIYAAVLGISIILNLGTNYFMGEISFITKSIAAVLQLALGLDYSIILSNRFTEEKRDHDPKEAIVLALGKGIPEIASSSLTTVAGLAALMLMQLKIGADMGSVLCKGIVFSLLTVFLLMPGLLLDCSKIIDKTRHKSFIPSIKIWCRMVVKIRYIVPFVFLVMMITGAFLSQKAPYQFDASSRETTRPTESSIAKGKIEETFGESHQMAVIVPKGDYNSEEKILKQLGKHADVTSATGLAGTEIEGVTLTRKITPRELAETLDLDYSLCTLLYQAYGAKNEEYGALVGDVSQYKISLLDLFPFIHDCIDKGIVTLSDEDKADIDNVYDTLEDAKKQLQGENYSRLVFTYSCPVESDEAYALLADAEKLGAQYYDSVLVAGSTTGAYDLKQTFNTDNKKISIFTFLALFLILVATFNGICLPLILALSIQGSVWINFSIPYLTNVPLMFLGYLVVSSVQMGATIDYAIVFANRYLSLRKEMPAKDAAITALDQAFPTIITSGSILAITGYLMYFVSTNTMISSLGKTLGQGTLISIIVVMLVVPDIVILLDKLIAKTTFKARERADKTRRRESSGTMVVDGRIDGWVCGYVFGEFKGVIRGDVNAKIDTKTDLDEMIEQQSSFSENEDTRPEE